MKRPKALVYRYQPRVWAVKFLGTILGFYATWEDAYTAAVVIVAYDRRSR